MWGLDGNTSINNHLLLASQAELDLAFRLEFFCSGLYSNFGLLYGLNGLGLK